MIFILKKETKGERSIFNSEVCVRCHYVLKQRCHSIFFSDVSPEDEAKTKMSAEYLPSVQKHFTGSHGIKCPPLLYLPETFSTARLTASPDA
jgi:hypothetical protein